LKGNLVSPTFIDQIHRDADIDSATIRLYFLSRDRSVLGLLVILLLALAAGIAFLVQKPSQPAKRSLPPAVELGEQLKSFAPDGLRLFQLLIATRTELPKEITEQISQSAMGPNEKLVANALVESIQEGAGEPNARMLILAHQPEPIPGANESVAELYAIGGQIERARDYYLRELNSRPEPALRERLVSLLVRHGDLASLRSLASDAAFAANIDAALRLKIALNERDWTSSARALKNVDLEALQTAPLILALVAGIAWLTIVVQAGQPIQWVSYRTMVPILAALAGFAAAWPAHFAAAWMEEIMGLRETGEFLSDLAFFMGSVAPREELIKLAFLLPFLPLLVIRRSPLETLVVSGCVGLGFAIEGNLQIYQHGGPGEAFGRLLTSNFFHFATTGLLGLSFCRFLFSPRRKLTGFIATMLGVILARGVYDAFMNIAGVRILALGSMLSFFIVSQVVFHELRRWRDQSTDQLFLAATLVISLTVLTGTTLVCAAMEIGFPQAVSAMTANAIALAIVVIVFFRQLGRKLSQITDEFLTPATQ